MAWARWTAYAGAWAKAWVEAAAWVIVPRLLTRPRPTPPRSSSRSARARPSSRDSPSPARRSRVRALSTSRARWKPPPPPMRCRTRRSPRTSRSTSGRTTTRSTRGSEDRGHRAAARSQRVGSPAAGLLDIENHAPALENRDRARGLRHANRDRVGRYRDGRGGLMAGAQALGKRLLELAPRGEIAPG